MFRVHLLCALLYGYLAFSGVVHAAGGIDDIARQGKPVIIDLTGYPDGTQALVNHALRADGWRPWFTEWPNDVIDFSFDAKCSADVQAIIDSFAAIKVRGKQVRLSALEEPANLGWVSRIPEGRKIPVLFTTGDQSTVDSWYKLVRKPFGQIEFTAVPVAIPPTLTIFVGNPTVKLRELKIPSEVEVVHGDVPGAFHRWNDKEADKAAARISVRRADVKLVTEINAFIRLRTEAASQPAKDTPAKEIESVPRPAAPSELPMQSHR